MWRRYYLPFFVVNLAALGVAVGQSRSPLVGFLAFIAVILMIGVGWHSFWLTEKPLRRFRATLDRLTAGDESARVLSDAQSTTGAVIRQFSVWHERERRETLQLRGALARSQAIFEQMGDGVLITTVLGAVQSANRAALTLFDGTQSDYAGRTFANFVRHHEIIELWQRALMQESTVSQVVEIGRSKLFLQVTITPLVQDNETVAIVALFSDLTPVRRLETVRRDFISNISHELRTPLASMRAVIETLQDGALDDPPIAQRFLGRAIGEVDSMTQMVEELLELSRIESGRVPLRLASVKLHEFAPRTVERLLPQAERKSIVLTSQISAELPPVVIDPARVEQVLTNLLHNGIKFTPEGGKISLAAKQRDDMAVVSVTDSGEGIPRHALPRIFERFYKTDQARTTGGGTGLGLAIAKHIVQLHGGEIWAESRIGKGSTFYFTLPLSNAANEPSTFSSDLFETAAVDETSALAEESWVGDVTSEL